MIKIKTMKWNIPNFRDGDTRNIRRFALFPVCTPTEMRWLEWVVIEQEWSDNWADDGWHNKRFIDEEVSDHIC